MNQMKKIAAVVLSFVVALTMAACNSSDADNVQQGTQGIQEAEQTGLNSDAPGETTSAITWNEADEADVDRRTDIDVLSASVVIDGKSVAVKDLSVQWMLDNGFVTSTDNDYSDDHMVGAYNIEGFSFVKEGSEENLAAAVVTLMFMNKSEQERPFSEASIYGVGFTLGSELDSLLFDDVSISGPFGLESGATLDDIEKYLGTPHSVVSAEEYGHTTYEWLTGEWDSVMARIGDTIGLFEFSVIIG